MRAWTRCGIALVLALAGCGDSCQHESTSEKPDPVLAAEKMGDCCSIQNRAALLKQQEPARQEAGKIDLQPITYANFSKEVQARSGKVVVLYAWASGHRASKQHLPDVIALQRKYGGKGLVCLTVSTDAEAKRPDALQVLEKAHCDLANYVQEEGESEAWEPCLGCCGLPVLVIHDRNGKRADHFDFSETPFDRPAIETALEKSLNPR